MLLVFLNLVAHVGVSGKLFDLVVEPLSSFRNIRFASPAPKGVDRSTEFIVSWAHVSWLVWVSVAGKVSRASIALTRSLEPVVRINAGRICRLQGGLQSDASTTNVAPVAVGAARSWVAVTAGVNNKLWVETWHSCVHVVAQDLHVVRLVVCKIILVQKTIWVNAAWVCWGWWVALAVNAWFALHAHGLVIRNVGREALRVVVPAQPAAVRTVDVHGGLRSTCREGVNGVLDALLVRNLRILAAGVADVGHQVWKRVRFNNQHHRHGWILRQYSGKLVDVLLPVLTQSIRAIAGSIVVASPVSVVRAADFTVRGESIAVTVGKIINHEHVEWRIGERRRVFQDTL